MSSLQRTDPPNRIGEGSAPWLWSRCRVLLDISSISANVFAVISWVGMPFEEDFCVFFIFMGFPQEDTKPN